MSKKITDNQILGERGVNLIQGIVLKMGFTWHGSNQAVEGGIDGWVELRDAATGEVENCWIAVQSKAVSEPRENETSIKYTPTLKDVEYWMKGNQPVVLVVSVPDRNEAWWVSVKDYYAGRNIEKDRMIVFHISDDLLTESTASEWKVLSEQHGSGTYFTPARSSETLISNLIRVWRWGSTIYSRKSKFTAPKEISSELREVFEWAPRDWFLADKMIYSFHDLSEPEWDAVCEGESKSIPSDDWAYSNDEETRRKFVRLLNHCLRQFIGRFRMRHSKEADCYYFHPDRDGVIRTLRYKSRKKKTSRGVVKRYMHKKDKDKIAYFRHDGFQHRFLRFGDAWYLMIEPDYVFTTDGVEPDPYREEHKSKIKNLEGDAAVAGTVVMFCDLFTDQGDLFTDAYPFLSFDQIVESHVPVGIDDAAWSRIKTVDEKIQAEEESEFAKGLFD